MKKLFLNILVGIVAGLTILFNAAPASAASTDLRPNDLNAAAAGWGNYQCAVTYADLTDTNTATFTQTIQPWFPGAKQGFECVGVALVKAFQPANTTNSSLVLQVGDSNNVSTFVTSTELNEQGTEVFWKYSTGSQIVYTAANAINLKFTGVTNFPVSGFTQGEVRVYFRTKDVTRPNRIP